MRRRCPICDREEGEVKFYGEICEVCTRDRISSSVTDKAEVTLCKRCGRIKTPQGFEPLGKESLAIAIRKQFKGHEIRVNYYSASSASITIYDETREGVIEVPKSIQIEGKYTICNDCYRKSSGYYEAVFQLRGDSQKMKMLLARLEHYFSKKGSYILSITDVDNGYDVRLPDKKLAASFIEAFGIKPSISYTLYGIKRGKKVYRNTYSIRL